MAPLFSKDLSLAVLIFITIPALLAIWLLFKSFLPRPKVHDFNKKYVLITGCDTGFGRTTAILLDQLGFHVIAACLAQKGKESIQEVCSDRLIGVLMDVTDSKQIQDVYEEVKRIIPGDAGKLTDG
jgi:NADPH:quinone reductase-like Zn-dependent oxidoreductase